MKKRKKLSALEQYQLNLRRYDYLTLLGEVAHVQTGIKLNKTKIKVPVGFQLLDTKQRSVNINDAYLALLNEMGSRGALETIPEWMNDDT